MAISIGSLGSAGNRTVGSVGGDTNTKIQDLLSNLQSSSSSGGDSQTNTSSSGGGCAGGCCNCANKTSNQARQVSGT